MFCCRYRMLPMFMTFSKSIILALMQMCHICTCTHWENNLHTLQRWISFCAWLVLNDFPRQLLLTTVGIRKMSWTGLLQAFLLPIITDYYLFFLIYFELELFGVSPPEASEFLFSDTYCHFRTLFSTAKCTSLWKLEYCIANHTSNLSNRCNKVTGNLENYFSHWDCIVIQ